MIYIDDHIWDFDLEQALAQVSAQRRDYALRFRQERDQRLCVAAYRLLQKALLQEYGINKLPQFTYNEVGKPLLEGLPHVHFSLSHCSEAAACCVSDQPVGMDIEVLTHYSEQVALRVMNDDEMCLIKASADPATAFTRLWTMKESLYKLTGDDADGNIAHLLDNTTDYRFTTLIYPQYILTQCTKHQSSEPVKP